MEESTLAERRPTCSGKTAPTDVMVLCSRPTQMRLLARRNHQRGAKGRLCNQRAELGPHIVWPTPT
jgi:hypothetical protein